MKNKKTIILTAALTVPGALFAWGSDDWARRAGAAALETARGNPQGVLYQAVPAVNTNLPTRAAVYANAGYAGIRQPLPVRWDAGRLGSGQASYQAGASYGLTQPPRPYHNVQVLAANRYVSNNTVLTPPPIKKKS